MKYLNYTVEDFVLDKEFREWVIKPNKELNLYWQNWLEKHPEKTGSGQAGSGDYFEFAC